MRRARYQLRVGGLVERSLEQLRKLPHYEQITQHFCIQGWSGVAKWGGVSMQTILDLVEPQAHGEVGGVRPDRAATTTRIPSSK